MNLVLFGPPGAGKGTQAQLICEKYRLTHLSTGDAIRAAIRQGNELGRRVKNCVEKGNLVSDELVSDLVDDFITNNRDKSGSFLFDGYPRTLSQAEQLERIIERHHLGAPAVVILDVPDDELMLRITGRRICADCKRTYNIYLSRLRHEDQCDNCHGPLLQRADDKPETVRERLRVYHEQTEPILHYYEMSGRLSTINGTGTPEQVFERIQKILAEHY